jgi:hypothetical protein
MAPTADAPIMVFIAPSPRLNIPIVRFQPLMNHPLGVVEDLHALRLADFPQERPAFDRRAEEAGEARQTSVEEDFLQGAEAGAALRVAQRCMDG